METVVAESPVSGTLRFNDHMPRSLQRFLPHRTSWLIKRNFRLFIKRIVCDSVKVPETGDSAETALYTSFRVMQTVVAEFPVSGTLRFNDHMPRSLQRFLSHRTSWLIKRNFRLFIKRIVCDSVRVLRQETLRRRRFILLSEWWRPSSQSLPSRGLCDLMTTRPDRYNF